MTKEYSFKSKIWLYPGKAGWHFLTLPVDVAKDIDYFFSMDKRGWGSLPVQVTIGKSTWSSSIFPDKKSDSYLLPLKAIIRKKENLHESDEVFVLLELKS